MLLLHSAVFTQSAATKDVPVRPAALRELHIGDRVPDLVVDNVLHYPGGTLKLSDFRGKLLILDFMSTGCKSCILKLPAYDSVQKQYGDRLQILLVTSDEKKYTGDVWKRNKFLSRITLPVVTEDSALAALFPHEVISHLAWIDAGGRVKAITTPQYVNAGNIDRVLNNEAVRWPVKKDILHFDRNIPLLELYGNRPEYYSTLTGYMAVGENTVLKLKRWMSFP